MLDKKLNLNSSPTLFDRGAASVEMAIVCGFLFLTFFPTFGISIYFLKQLSIQYSVQEGMRWAILGLATDSSDPRPPRIRYSRESVIQQRIQRTAKSFGVDLNIDDIHICPASGTPYCDENDAGVGDQMISIAVEHPVPFFAGQGLVARASVIGKNEPFL